MAWFLSQKKFLKTVGSKCVFLFFYFGALQPTQIGNILGFSTIHVFFWALQPTQIWKSILNHGGLSSPQEKGFPAHSVKVSSPQIEGLSSPQIEGLSSPQLKVCSIFSLLCSVGCLPIGASLATVLYSTDLTGESSLYFKYQFFSPFFLHVSISFYSLVVHCISLLPCRGFHPSDIALLIEDILQGPGGCPSMPPSALFQLAALNPTPVPGALWHIGHPATEPALCEAPPLLSPELRHP